MYHHLWYIFFFLPHISIATVLLKNSQWYILLDPSNLALHIRPYNDTSFTTISTGTSLHHSVHLNNQTTTLLSWNWNQGKYTIELSLQQNDLHLTILPKNATTGPLQILNQPAGQTFGQGLILPLAEGHFIPSQHSLWTTYLLEHFNDIDTTKDLSLPLWGMQYQNYNVHWILTNPFYNRLSWKPSPDGENGLQLTLTHQFSALDPTTPFTAILHLSPSNNSLLSGAKRYRQFLIDQGRFVTLKDKIEMNPTAEKILGATHLYIWGGYPLDYDNINNWPVFLSAVPKELLVQGRTWPDEYEHERIEIENWNNTAPFSSYAKHRVITEYNRQFAEWARERWQNIDEFPIKKLISNYVGTYDTLRFNPAICWNEPGIDRLGGGFSMKTIEKLMEANLTNLLIVLGDGWEAGLWHHPVVKRAVEEMGYLVAPYDGYQYALHGNDTEHSKWIRGYLGNKVYDNCGVVGGDGKVVKGFNGQAGHWINPKCVREKMEERITWIGNATGCNSWFLDGYGSGLVLEDFRKGGSMSQGEMAKEFERSLEFAGNLGNGTVVGSEYGNAVVSKGLVYAHGMQTPNMVGWEVEDGEREGERIFGGWLPVESPDLFLKPGVIKEPFKTVHFDWRYRLPLYQAVFHGSVVTSHHFMFDCLKVENVRKENILMGLLYNVAPLFHISKETMGERLEIILRIDEFFKPLHKLLGMKELVEFGWLDENKNLQQTVFDDGTRIIANFGEVSENVKENLSINSFTVIAIREDGNISRFSLAEKSEPKNSTDVKIKTKSKPSGIISNTMIGVVCSFVLIGVCVIFIFVLYAVKFCSRSKGKFTISLKRARARSCSNVS